MMDLNFSAIPFRLNTLDATAGGAVLIAELLYRLGYFD